MTSQYPVLDNKPIDQWRVTDLREELRRRKLVTKGLKEELVKRLEEALQKDVESENVGELGNGDESNSNLRSSVNEEDPTLEGADDKQAMLEEEINTDKGEAENGDIIEVVSVGKDEESTVTTGDFVSSGADRQNFNAFSGIQDEDLEPQKFGKFNSPIVGMDDKTITSDLEGVAPINSPIVGMDEKLCELGVAPVNQNILSQSDIQIEEDGPVGMFVSKPPIVRLDEKEAIPGCLNDSEPNTLGVDAEPEKEFKESEQNIVESTVIQLEQSNQVSEVSQDFEFQVKYKSISTDSVSIIEKHNIKDNLTADHFPLELVVKQEVMQPSSSSYPTRGGPSCLAVDEQEAAKNHDTDVQVTLQNQVLVEPEMVQNLLSDKKETNIRFTVNEHNVDQTHDSCQQGINEEHAYVDDADMQNASILEPHKKEDCVEASSPEKLNLDRSSGDESMEEDILDAKHMEAEIKSMESDSKNEPKMLDIQFEEKGATDVSKSSSKMKEIAVEDVELASLTEKRKMEETEVVVNNGPPKRHRRWNPDTIKVPEQQTPHANTTPTPKSNLQPALRRTFSMSNSTSSVDSPKDRIVPTPKKPATTSLRIDNFLRPFTLKAVQELLAKTGQVCDFWMDHIKTHCYVTYSSVEEATETRNAVYNLQWPPNGGRFLVADFVDPQEVKLRLEVPPPSPAPIISNLPTPKAAPPPQQTQSPKPTHQQNLRLQPLPPPPAHPLPPPPPLLVANPPIARERLPPPPPKKPEPPVMTLDDLFKKTRATPRIYYLPLTEEQVSAKLAAESKRTQV